MLGRLATHLAIGLLKLLALLPYGLTARFGDGLGWLLYKIPSRRKRIVHTNLKLCFLTGATNAARKLPGSISAMRSAATSNAACSGSARRKSSRS